MGGEGGGGERKPAPPFAKGRQDAADTTLFFTMDCFHNFSPPQGFVTGNTMNRPCPLPERGIERMENRQQEKDRRENKGTQVFCR